MFAYLLHRFVEKPAAGWLRKRMKAGSFSLQR
jgi:peptidoglycan/LPS O-acetylase OafA/YrhL